MEHTHEPEQRYEANRLKKLELDGSFRRYFIFHIAIAALAGGMALFGAAGSSRDGGHHGAYIFYNSFQAGAIGLLIAVGMVVGGFIAAAKNRIASLICGMASLLLMILALIPAVESVPRLYVLPALLCTALEIWGQFLFSTDDLLRAEPGYPHFEFRADTPAQYEAPLYVKVRRGQAEAASEMDVVGKRTGKNPLPLPSMSEAALGISAIDGTPEAAPHPVHFTEASLREAAALELQSLADEAANANCAEVPVQPPADILIEDMTAEGTQHHQYAPREEALESAEAVRARLARMKRGQQEPPAGGTASAV